MMNVEKQQKMKDGKNETVRKQTVAGGMLARKIPNIMRKLCTDADAKHILRNAILVRNNCIGFMRSGQQKKHTSNV